MSHNNEQKDTSAMLLAAFLLKFDLYLEQKLKLITAGLGWWVDENKINAYLISSLRCNISEVEQDVVVVEAGADLQYTFSTDRRTGRSDNNAISALRCSCS